ncbi:hypothetical protein DPMN_191336 [Dreissena polymorpha]|uniref:Uncharacterized protein n=1 Tax=Dreissena polymorpha TaxID=45954 RepID=A0A9D3Y073_DREPO|nr:hypothetical protein DPMN_191336 [Dreissena polymorpha]
MIETDSEIENSQTVVKKLQKNNDSKSGANVKIGKNEQSNNENLLKVTTRASKRLSSTNLQEHSTPSKRTLRSSGGKTDFNETDLDVTPWRKTRCSASKAEKMDTTTDEIKQEPIETEFVTPVTIHGRGRQKAGTQRYIYSYNFMSKDFKKRNLVK